MGGVRILFTRCLLKPLTEVFRPHYRQYYQEVQRKPVHFPGNLLVFGDQVLNGKWSHTHGDRLDRQWDVPVQLYPLRRHTVDGHSGWGRGVVNGVLVPSPHPYPQLYDHRQIGSDEGLHRGPRLGRPVALVLLDTRLDLLDEKPDSSLFSVPAMG